MAALIPTSDGDYIINFGRRYVGKRLSWVVKHQSYWLREYILTAYPGIADIVEDALRKNTSVKLTEVFQ